MIVKSMNESAIYAIGHAFGYYDYGEETGMVYAFSGQEPTAQYICAYVRGMLRGGFLHTTSERGEGYIAYKRPKEKLGSKILWPIATGMLHNSSMKRLMRFAMAIKKGGKSLQERMDKEKKPYIFVGMVCVCEKYQEKRHSRRRVRARHGHRRDRRLPSRHGDDRPQGDRRCGSSDRVRPLSVS